MRINMTYRNSCTTSADFCPTIGHDVFTEGAFEGIYRAILTTDEDTCEFQFQVATITWTTKDGQDRHYTFDGGRITVDGVERWFEIKAHASYFKLPDVADVLDQAERALAAHDIALDRIDGSALLDHVRLRAVNGVLRHRNVPTAAAMWLLRTMRFTALVASLRTALSPLPSGGDSATPRR